MMKINKVLAGSFAIIGVLGLGACSSGQKFEQTCTTTDWQSEGYKAGVKGTSSTEILKTERACAKKGFEVSVVDYKEGWLKGIAQYCSAKNAYTMGLKGKEANVENCPVELRTDFENNYARAQKYEANKKIISKKEEKINDLKKSVSKLEDEKNKLMAEQTDIKNKAEKVSSKSLKYDIK